MTYLQHSRASISVRWCRVLAGALALWVCLIVGAANASPSTGADSLIEQGVKLRVQGKNSEALEHFKKAHALAPSARTLAQVGLAEGALRQWIDAEDHLVAALAAHDTPWIANPKNLEALEHALSAIRGHIGRVAVVGPAGADVTINGMPVGRLPLPEAVRVAEGRAEIVASAAGRRPAQARTDVTGGSTVTVTLDLPALPPPPVAAPSAPPAVLVGTETPPRSRAKTWAGASLLAVSAAAVATGIVWVAVDSNPTCSAPSGTVCQNLYDTKAQGWITIAAGAASGVAGGLLLWQGREHRAGVGLAPGALTIAAEF